MLCCPEPVRELSGPVLLIPPRAQIPEGGDLLIDGEPLCHLRRRGANTVGPGAPDEGELGHIHDRSFGMNAIAIVGAQTTKSGVYNAAGGWTPERLFY